MPSQEVQILEVSEVGSSKLPIGGKKRAKQTSFATSFGGQTQKTCNQQRSRMSTEEVSKLSKRVRKEAFKEKLDQYACPILPCKRQCRNARELRLHFLTSHFLEETNREYNKGDMEHCEKCNGVKGSSLQYLKHVAYHEPEKVMKKVQSALNI